MAKKYGHGYDYRHPIRSAQPIVPAGSISGSFNPDLSTSLSYVWREEYYAQDYMISQLPIEQQDAAVKRLKVLREEDNKMKIWSVK